MRLKSGKSATRGARTGEFVELDQRDLGRPVLFAKIFGFSGTPNHLYIPAIPSHTRGAFRDRHGRWARDAVDAAASARNRDRRAGPTRERCTGAQTNDGAADGEVVWS